MKSDKENREWLDEYVSLKQVTPGNPFTVPTGYFNDFEERVLLLKKIEELKTNESQIFTVPENYFDELSANIKSRIAIEHAVNGADAGFAVPVDYFDNLEQHIKSRVAIEAAVVNSNPFTVPAGYFEELSENTLSKTVNQTTVKRSGVLRKLFVSTAFKYATAACFVLLIGSGLLIRKLTDPVYQHQNSFLHKQLSTVPVDDIQSYLQINADANDTQRGVVANDLPVDDNNLKQALKEYADSVQ